MHNTFYKLVEGNEGYQNRIKSKKVELQQKAKVYKASLMLELNKSQRISLKKEEQEEISQIRKSNMTEPYRKKRHSISTASELQLVSTKSNSIYKRWDKPGISDKLSELEK